MLGTIVECTRYYGILYGSPFSTIIGVINTSVHVWKWYWSRRVFLFQWCNFDDPPTTPFVHICPILLSLKESDLETLYQLLIPDDIIWRSPAKAYHYQNCHNDQQSVARADSWINSRKHDIDIIIISWLCSTGITWRSCKKLLCLDLATHF